MYLVIDENNSISKLEKLNWEIQQAILEGMIDVIDCETMQISDGWAFHDLPNYYDEDEE